MLGLPQPTTLDLVNNDDDDGVPDRMARRMAAILIIDKATSLGMPEGTIEELRQEFRKVHPRHIPPTLTTTNPGPAGVFIAQNRYPITQ